MRFSASVKKLESSSAGSAAAEVIRRDLERQIMTTIRAGGVRSLRALIADADCFSPIVQKRPRYEWQSNGNVAIRCVIGGGVYAVSVIYEPKRPQAEESAEHVEFYARYNAAAGRRSLSADDRLILLIAEFEADINNGGFAQYIANKGRRRAQSAARALVSIGANVSHELLTEALRTSPRNDLDERFYDAAEDLAGLTMRYVKGRDSSSRDTPK